MLNETSIDTSEFEKLISKFDASFVEDKIKTLKTLTDSLAAIGHKRIIYDRLDNEPYLERYYLLNCRPYCRLVLHKFLKSDIDGLHDHPWGFENYVITGGYWEHTREGKFWRGPGYQGKYPANYFHRIELDPQTTDEVWTAVLMGPKEKDWGFLNESNDWVQWEEFLNLKKRGADNVQV